MHQTAVWPAQDWRWQQEKRSKHAAPLLGRPGVVKDNRKTIYVKGLPFAAEEADIEGFFSACGKVVDVRRGTNSEGADLKWEGQCECWDTLPG